MPLRARTIVALAFLAALAASLNQIDHRQCDATLKGFWILGQNYFLPSRRRAGANLPAIPLTFRKCWVLMMTAERYDPPCRRSISPTKNWPRWLPQGVGQLLRVATHTPRGLHR
jgi:hypothetical protein